VPDFIRIRGARVHNLKNIPLSIPHNQLTVLTGVSGSGKSSLAFDTIYAEGQRRYVESSWAIQAFHWTQAPPRSEGESSDSASLGAAAAGIY
jgi:excinuclease UvrABC ATPase subunit